MKVDLLKMAIKLTGKHIERAVADETKLKMLENKYAKRYRRQQKRVDAAREEYGKVFIQLHPHDSDADEEVWDSDIEATTRAGTSVDSAAGSMETD